MTVPDDDIVRTFRYLLGRKPNAAAMPRYDSVHQMLSTIFRSDEFKAAPKSRKNGLTWPLSQVFVSQRAQVLYCPIGKNACTFLKRQVAASAGVENLPLVQRDIHLMTDRVNTGLQLSDYDLEKVDDFLGSADYLRFAVIRNPGDRLLSAFIEKFVINRSSPANINHTRTVIDPVQGAQGRDRPDYDLGISFRDFVTWVTAQPGTALDAHWRPQALYLKGVDYDRLYGFERLDAVIDLLEERSGIPLARQAQNVTGSGKGIAVEGADRFLPSDIAAQPRIDKASFLVPDLCDKIDSYFAEDTALHHLCLAAPFASSADISSVSSLKEPS